MPDVKVMRRENFMGKIGTLLGCLMDGSAEFIKIKDGERDLCGVFLQSSRYLKPLAAEIQRMRLRPMNVSNALYSFHAPSHEQFYARDMIIYVAPRRKILPSPFYIVPASRFEEMNIPSP